MAPQKRRKAYLDPGSTASIPRATKWRLSSSADSSTRASRRTAVQTRQGPAATSSQESPCSDCDNDSRSSRQHDTDDVDSELACDSDDNVSDWDAESERATSPCDTSFFTEEEVDEVPSGEYDLSKDAFSAEELTLPFIEGGRLTRGDAYMMLLDVAVKFGLSWTAVEEIQRLFNNLLEKKSVP